MSVPTIPRKRVLRGHQLALAAYIGFAFLLLYPIWWQNGTHVAGYDWFNYNWNFWWIGHALQTPGLSVYLNDFTMFPALSNYGYHALTAFWYPVWALLAPWAGTLTAVNVIITLICVLNGFITFVWLRSEGVSQGLALLGGVVLQTLPISRYFYYNTHLNLGDWFWLPGLLLLWKHIVHLCVSRARGLPHDPGQARLSLFAHPIVWGLVFGVALWGLLLTDLQFPIFAAAVAVPYGLLTLVLARIPGAPFASAPGAQFRVRVQLLASGLVGVSAGLALMWFAGPLPYILRFQGELVPGPVTDRPGIPFPGGFLSMAREWWQWDQPSLGAFFPLALLVSVAIAVRHLGSGRWLRWFWLACALPPLVFAMGPYLRVGSADIPMPFIWFYDLTNGMFRMPWRLAPIGVVAGLAFVGLVWTPILNKRPTLHLWAGVAALLLCSLAVRLGETRPLDPVLPDYAFYHAMGDEQGDPYERYVVLDAPTGMGTGEVLLGNMRAIQYQYYGMIHHKRTVNGFISRTPIDQFYYIETGDPLLSWLGQRVPLDAEAAERLLRERIYDWPIGYIVVHIDDIGRNTSTPQEIIGYFNQLDDLVCPLWIEVGAVAYRTRWHPDGCPARTPPEITPGIYQIDLGALGDERFIGWGWHWQEDVGATRWRWSGERADARLYFDIPPADYLATVATQAFWETRDLQVVVNGVTAVPMGTGSGSTGGGGAASSAVRVAPGALQRLTFSLPAEAIGDGRHVEMRLVYDDTVVPVEVGQSDDPRRLALAVDWIELRRVDSP